MNRDTRSSRWAGSYRAGTCTHLIPVFSAVAVILLLTSPAGATDYYVSTTGSNSNSGTTLNQPFLTIQQAANVAHAGDTVNVLGGTYRETVTM